MYDINFIQFSSFTYVPSQVLVGHIPISRTWRMAQGQGHHDFWDYYYKFPHNYVSVMILIWINILWESILLMRN